MPSNKALAQRTAGILEAWGVRDIVFSPGSRNAPLVIAFASLSTIRCHVVPDERVAAFMALGIAQETLRPVAIACTSGSAPLNYAPAIAEAYYQRIPLVVLTADRPAQWIDQGIGQTMRQDDVYHNYIQASYKLIGEETQEYNPSQNDHSTNLAMQSCLQHQRPVHINIPFDEPLYTQCSSLPTNLSLHQPCASTQLPSSSMSVDLQKDWTSANKIMLLIGQRHTEDGWHELIEAFAKRRDLVILTETCSNFLHPAAIPCIDRTLLSLSDQEEKEWQPDLILKMGGAIISKKIKKWLRESDAKHYEIIQYEESQDTFGKLRGSVHPATLQQILPQLEPKSSTYWELWTKRHKLLKGSLPDFLSSCPWSDLLAVSLLWKHMPAGSTLHQANSTSVRYLQLFEQRSDLDYRANRGVSGIDGCSSTAIGAALVSSQMHVLITGDLAFLYDSNALWVESMPKNARIVVLNNGGGDIFNIIPGPKSTSEHQRFFVTKHNRSVHGIVKGFGLSCVQVNNQQSMIRHLPIFLSEQSPYQVMEVWTQNLPNSDSLQGLFDYMKDIAAKIG